MHFRPTYDKATAVLNKYLKSEIGCCGSVKGPLHLTHARLSLTKPEAIMLTHPGPQLNYGHAAALIGSRLGLKFIHLFSSNGRGRRCYGACEQCGVCADTLTANAYAPAAWRLVQRPAFGVAPPPCTARATSATPRDFSTAVAA